jgi:hypothetical protein
MNASYYIMTATRPEGPWHRYSGPFDVTPDMSKSDNWPNNMQYCKIEQVWEWPF